MLPDIPLSAAHALLVRGGSASISTSSLRGGVASTLTNTGFALGLEPPALSVLMMALAMSLHFFGYEFARSATLTLFTSKTSGFNSNSALPLVLACVCPASLVLLNFYTGLLDAVGPRATLRGTAAFCSAGLAAFAVVISSLVGRNGGGPPGKLIKFFVFSLFVFREAYVQLLATQHWSFMGSVLNASKGATWFGPIAGASSASSAVAGYTIGPLVNKFGVCGLLILASISLVGSLILGEVAYEISEKHGFNPADEHFKEKKAEGAKNKGKENNIFSKANNLFARVPALKFLFLETLICQGLSTVLNVTFICKLRRAYPIDKDRAGFMGMFYALANMASGVFQFGVIPQIIHFLKPTWVWIFMPCVMMAMSGAQLVQSDPGLTLVAGAFMTMKTLEYSIRGVANELLYVPLDYESRYIGKEVIGMLGYRLGKSGMSLMLSGAGYFFAEGLGVNQLTAISSSISIVWLAAAVKLTRFLPEGRIGKGIKTRKH
ncbi:hypothetical protein TrLO_g14205 [Triparma laevis f. longispina]|uniref:ADP,ATP carrier protein n=2 Tax=Triparma laevis TaxID=1534972 RepID=A0A9W7F2U5_9STRA|nr:hypothetical protein TrLO_g14205 [Triparma laevis f. longispina]